MLFTQTELLHHGVEYEAKRFSLTVVDVRPLIKAYST